MAFPFRFGYLQGYQDSLLNLHNFRYTTSLYEVYISVYAQKLEDSENLVRGLLNLASMAQIKIGMLSAAEKNLRRAIDLCDQNNYRFLEMVGHQELGRVSSYCGAWREANQELRNYLKRYSKVEFRAKIRLDWAFLQGFEIVS